MGSRLAGTRNVALIVGLMALAVATRAWALGKRSLWVDEAFSVWLAAQPARATLQWVAEIDQHPPLYYLLLAVWGRLWGWSEGAVRALSVVLGLATIPWAYALARQATGQRPNLWMLLVFALSPLHVRYAREARMYALLFFTTTLMTWAAVRLVSEAWPARRRVWSACFAAAALAAVYTHHMAWLSVASVVAVLALWAWWEEAGSRRSLFFAAAAVIVGWAPWAPFFVHQATGVLRRFWIPAPSLAAFAELVHAFLAAYTPLSAPLLFFDVVVIAVAARGVIAAWQRPERRWVLAVLAAAALGPPLLALGVSVFRPVFQVRTVIGACVPFLVLVALGIASLQSTGLRRVLVAAWVSFSVWGVVQVHMAPDPEPWRDVAAFVAPRVQPGDAILFHASWVQIPFDYYFRRYHVNVAEYGAPVDLFQRGEIEPAMRPEDVPAVLSRLRGHKRIWLVYSHDWYTDPAGLLLRGLEVHFCQRGLWQWPNIRLFLFVPCAEARRAPVLVRDHDDFFRNGGSE